MRVSEGSGVGLPLRLRKFATRNIAQFLTVAALSPVSHVVDAATDQPSRKELSMSNNNSKEFQAGQNNGSGYGQHTYTHYGDYLKGRTDYAAGKDSNKK